jgi:hypothetical protein
MGYASQNEDDTEKVEEQTRDSELDTNNSNDSSDDDD